MVSKNKHNILGESLKIKKLKKKILLSIIITTYTSFLYYSSNITM